MGACVSAPAVQVADWTGEGMKPSHRPAPAGGPRTSGSRPLAALPSTAELDSPTLSMGSSLYSLYTEASSEEGAGQAAVSPRAAGLGAPDTPLAAAKAPSPPVVVSEPLQGLELGAVIGRWGGGLTYLGTWDSKPVAVTISDHRLDTPEKARELEQRLRLAACSADLRHPSLAPLYCCSLVRRTEEAEPVVCECCAVGGEAALCDHGEEGAEWQQFLRGDSGTSSGPKRLEVWAVSELGYCTLEGAIRRGWLHFDSSSGPGGDGAAQDVAAEAKRPRMRRILHVAHDIAAGLQFMHSKGLVHGELSGGSVAVCSGPRGYKAKLGSALHQATRTASAAERRGMEAPRMELLLHTAPEVLMRGEEAGSQADVYALGTCMWEMFSGKLACPQVHPVALLRAHHARRSPLPPLHNCPPAFEALITACMAPSAADRPSVPEILSRLEAMLAVH